MKEQRGFTLIEMVVVLAVIAILAAVLTPIISSYVERARLNAAQNDLKNIGAAILQFNTDTGIWPIYVTAADVPNGHVYSLVYTNGNTPSVSAGATGWTVAFANSNAALDTVLNTNYLNLTTTGTRAWKGAYLNLGADPWGTAYIITSANLLPSDTTDAAYIISAGPNQQIETPLAPPRSGTLVPSGDDLIVRIK